MGVNKEHDEFQGRAVVQDGGKTTTVALQPVAPNMLVGKAEGPVGERSSRLQPRMLAEMRSSGFLADSIARSGIEGLTVAPADPRER